VTAIRPVLSFLRSDGSLHIHYNQFLGHQFTQAGQTEPEHKTSVSLLIIPGVAVAPYHDCVLSKISSKNRRAKSWGGDLRGFRGTRYRVNKTIKINDGLIQSNRNGVTTITTGGRKNFFATFFNDY
jgi:hypothetical protein